LNHLDGEMIALDGSFHRADIAGKVSAVPPTEKTPFAVMAAFDPTIEFELEGSVAHDELLAQIDERIPEGAASCAMRLDGRFELVTARSVPRQSPPYRALTEVVAEQKVFELRDLDGTMVGFRFPDYAEGLEVGGYHLHFISEDRALGGHVLDSRASTLRVHLDPSSDLHVELPPGIELLDEKVAADTHAAVERVERQG